MEVTGKLVALDGVTLQKNYGEATIELPPVDVSKIKEGDKVWVKTFVRTVKEGSDFIELNCCNDLIDIESIIVHFPQLQPKQEQNCKCPPDEFRQLPYAEGAICSKCKKPFPKNAFNKILELDNKPEVKVPEELKECPLSMFDNSAWRAWMATTIIKINEIIEYLEKKE